MGLFTKKEDKLIKDILTQEQDDRALLWLKEHVLHVMDIVMKCDGKVFPPTREDKSQPNQWKPV